MAETAVSGEVTGSATASATAIQLNAPVSRRRSRWRQAPFSFWFGVGLLVVIFGVAILAPYISPADPIRQNPSAAFRPPGGANLMGTDNFGRDIFSRVLHGTAIDLQIGIISVLFPFLIGTAFGCITGYFSGWVDMIIGRVVDVIVAFPYLILVIALMAMLGPGLNNLYIAVALVGWIAYHRIVRGETLVTRALDFVTAARTIGATDTRILWRHVLPNVVTPAIVYSMSHIVTAILLGASLSFLGLGVPPPAPEWGAIISDSRPFMLIAWWIPTFPGIALMLTGLAFSLVGDGLADLLRPEIGG